MQRCSEALKNSPKLLDDNRLELVRFSVEAPHQAHEMLAPMRRVEAQAQCRSNKSLEDALQFLGLLTGLVLAGVEPVQTLLIDRTYTAGKTARKRASLEPKW